MKDNNESSTEDLNRDSKTPVVFKANHPFVFVILDKETGVICFMGVFADPKEMLEVVNEKDMTREEIHKLLAEEDDDQTESNDGSSYEANTD